MTLEELKVLITAETSGLTKELNNVKSQVSGLEKSVTKSNKKISSSFKNLFKGISVVAVTAALLKIGKTALNTASDLAEVQNVVDVSFGAAAEEIDDFAKSALKSFGLSELSAKQASSTYKAMANGMGVASDAGKEMAINLTKLTGDMASFYNVQQDVASTALKSVFTGETEALKKFGIVMTEANLKAFALSEGITKQYSEMSQAEKVALRYNFVMKSTSQVQGDFARTGGSWANQIKLLKEQCIQLTGILGQALTKVLLPIVKALNEMLSSAIAVANALAQTFGFNGIKSSAASVETLTDSTDGLGESLEEDAKAAKSLKTLISGFDELNVLQKDDSSSSAASIDGGMGMNLASYVEGTGEVIEEETSLATSKFKDFVEECKDIINKWVKDIPRLEIHFNSEEALANLKNIGTNILNTIAGWGSFAITLTINVINDLDLGVLANKVLALWDSVTGLASELTNALVPAFQQLYDIALKPIVQFIGTLLADALDFLSQQVQKVTQWVKQHSEGLQAWARILGQLVNLVWSLIEPLASAVWNTFKTVLSGIFDILGWILGVVVDLGKIVEPIITTIVEAIKGLIQKIQELKTNIVDKFKTAWSSAKQSSSDGLTNIKNGLASFKTFFDTTINAIGNLLRTVISTAINNAITNFNNLRTNVTNVMNTMKNTISTILNSIKTTFTNVFTNVKTSVTNKLNELKSSVTSIVTSIKDKVQSLVSSIGEKINNIKNKLASLVGINVNTTYSGGYSFASGGVVTRPTQALVGEYPSARTNPEIITPESKMRDILSENNADLLSGFVQMTRQIVRAIEDKDFDVQIGDDTIAKSAARGNNNYKRITGRPLITV